MAAQIRGSAFSSLQKALKEGGPLVFFAFDLLRLDGEDLRTSPQIARRERLERLLSGVAADGPLRLSEHIIGGGPEVFAEACKAGAEGIISKRIDAPYRSRRSKAWRKLKCTRRQEFVIVGYAPSDKPGRAFASLLLASHEGERLRYKGRGWHRVFRGGDAGGHSGDDAAQDTALRRGAARGGAGCEMGAGRSRGGGRIR